MKIITFLTTILFSLFLLSTSIAQTVEELIQEGDKYNTEFNHQKSLETYQKAEKLDPGNWEVLWRISRALVDIANKLPEGTDEQKDDKKRMKKLAFLNIFKQRKSAA